MLYLAGPFFSSYCWATPRNPASQLTCAASTTSSLPSSPPSFLLPLPACRVVCLPATVQQFRSTASVRLDDFMENFIEQAETISFGAINVVRWTQWQLQREEERERLVGGLNGWGVLFECF